MSASETKTETEIQQQRRLEKIWNAVPQDAGKKGCVLDSSKEILGVLAIADDNTLVLKRQCPDDFVVVSLEEAADWRFSPYNESHDVRFVCISDLLAGLDGLSTVS